MTLWDFLLMCAPCSKSTAKQDVYANIKELQKDIFKQLRRAGHTLKIDPTLPTLTFLKLTNKLQKWHSAILFQLCTGHAPLNHHLHQITKVPLPLCDTAANTKKW